MAKVVKKQIYIQTIKKISAIEIHETQQLQNKPTKHSGPIQAINYHYFE